MNDLSQHPLAQAARAHAQTPWSQTQPPSPLRVVLVAFLVICLIPWVLLLSPHVSTVCVLLAVIILAFSRPARRYLALSARLWGQRLAGSPWHWDKRPSPGTRAKAIVALVLFAVAPFTGSTLHKLDLGRVGGVDPNSWNPIGTLVQLGGVLVCVLAIGVPIVSYVVARAARSQSGQPTTTTDVPQTREELEGDD